MFLVSAVKASFLNLIYHGAGTVVHLLLLKFSMSRAVVVVQLTVRSLPIPEVPGSNPVIGNFY